MPAYIKKITLIILTLVATFFMVQQWLNPIDENALILMFESSASMNFAFIIILFYLLFHVYREASKAKHTKIEIIQSAFLFALAMWFLIHMLIGFSQGMIRFYLSFRMTGIIALILVSERFLDTKKDVNKYILMFIFTVSMSVMVFLLKSDYYGLILSAYYYVGILYMTYIYYKNANTTHKSIKYWLYLSLIFALVFDLAMLAFGIHILEMSYTIAALGIVVVYCIRFWNKYKQFQSLLHEKQMLLEENIKLKKSNKRAIETANNLKDDLSIKFKRKQHYFENLEIALEVLQGSIIIVNSDFKIAFAHGSILDFSEYDDLTGLDVSRALFDLASEEGQYFKSVVMKIFAAQDQVREHLYLSLLDDRLLLNNRLYEVTYHAMHKRNSEKVLIIHAEVVNEQTQQGALFLREKEIFQMVTTVSKNSEMFFSDISAYLSFSRQLEDYVDKDLPVSDQVLKYLKRIHTFKSVFDQYNMQSTVIGLNDVENELLNMLHHEDEFDAIKLHKILRLYNFETIMQSDLRIIEEKLGEDFLENKHKISVDVTKFSRLSVKLKEILGQDHLLLEAFSSLADVDIKEVLKAYKPYIGRIGEEQGKTIEYNVSGDSVFIRRSLYVHFFEALIHVFKNSVEHGIEYPDERRKLSKPENGKINCHVLKSKDQMIVTIRDDGRGVDLKGIKNRLFISGKYTMEALEVLEDEVVCNMILEDGISTSDVIGHSSNKGVGMGTIKEVVESLGGSAKVFSKTGLGVTYEFALPLNVKAQIQPFNLGKFQDLLTLQTEKMLTNNDYKTQYSKNWELKADMCVQEDMLDVGVHIDVLGVRHIKICITCDEKMLRHLAKYLGSSYDLKVVSLGGLNECLGSFSQNIVHNTIEVFKSPRQVVEQSHPILMTKKSFEEIYVGRPIGVSKLDIGQGRMKVIVLVDQKDREA